MKKALKKILVSKKARNLAALSLVVAAVPMGQPWA